jgi:hypothetical protein
MPVVGLGVRAAVSVLRARKLAQAAKAAKKAKAALKPKPPKAPEGMSKAFKQGWDDAARKSQGKTPSPKKPAGVVKSFKQGWKDGGKAGQAKEAARKARVAKISGKGPKPKPKAPRKPTPAQLQHKANVKAGQKNLRKLYGGVVRGATATATADAIDKRKPFNKSRALVAAHNKRRTANLKKRAAQMRKK